MLLTDNACVLQTYHTVQDNIAWPVTYPDTGVLRQGNAKAANKTRILTQAENHALTAPMIDLCGTATSAFPAQQDQTLTQPQADANCVHQDSHTTKPKDDAHVLNKPHTYTKTTPVLTANHHTSGTNKPNHVTLVL